MNTSCLKNRLAKDNSLLRGKRFVYVGGDAKENAPQPVPEAETFDKRKEEALKAIDGVYDSDKYDTYNIRKLPEDFKSLLRNNFGEWIGANIAKYDEDKNSGIDAEEFRRFEKELSKVVEGVLDRLAEIKKEKTEAAEEMKETAEQAQERQKRLEGVDVTKVDPANLETADGIFTELLKYQKDFENEATGFGELATLFTGTKETIDNANKPQETGLAAVGEFAQNHPILAAGTVIPGIGLLASAGLAAWAEDTPAVAEAKKAKEKAVEDFRTKLGEMRTRQKQRQDRGKKLNGAPEGAKSKLQKEYSDEESKTEAERDKVKTAKEAKEKEVAKQKADLQLVTQSRIALQDAFNKIAIASQGALERQQQAQEKEAEVEKTSRGLEQADKLLRDRQRAGAGAGAAQGGKASPMQKLENARQGAAKTQREIAKALKDIGIEIKEMDMVGFGLQAQVLRLFQHSGILEKGIKSGNEVIQKMDVEYKNLDDRLTDLHKEEKDRIDQIDSLDEAIASTVLEVDTSNFELIKKGDDYLTMLNGMTISGPGIFDSIGAVLKGIPGVDAAASWTGDKLAAIWEWSKEAPVLGSVIGGVQWAGGKWVEGWDYIGESLAWAGDKMHLQEAWDWMSNASTILANTDNAVLSWAGGFGGTIIEVFAGITEGAKDLVKSLGLIVRNPIDLVKGLGGLLNHPEMILDALIQKDKWGPESSGKVIGRLLFDVITTCTGAGATATGVKTALAAIKLGEMTAGRAILLGIETFGRAFVKDLGQIIKGAITLPKNVVQGLVGVVKKLTGSGKKIEPAAGTMTVAAKRAKDAEEAYHAVEAARGNPDKFKAVVRKNPHSIALHDEHLAKLKKAGRKVEEAEHGAVKPAPKKAVKAGKTAKKEPKRTGETVKAEAPGRAEPPAAVKEMPPAALKSPSEFKPDFTMKELTKDRLEMLDRFKESLLTNKALKAVKGKMTGKEFTRLQHSLPDDEMRLLLNSLDDLDSTMVEKILKQEYKQFVENGEIVRFYVGETLGKGGFGVVSDCAFVKGGGGKLEVQAVKIQRSLEPFKLEMEKIRVMLRDGKLSPEETGLIRKKIDSLRSLREKSSSDKLSGRQVKKLSGEIEELERMLKEVVFSDESRAYFGRKIAGINSQIEDFNAGFIREKNGLAMSKGKPGLLQVRHMSGPGSEHMIIINRVEAIPGEGVTWQERMADINIPAETTIDDMQTVVQALDDLHADGLIHGDFNGKQIMKGKVNGETAVVLGDLSLMPVDQLAQGVGLKLPETRISGRSISFKLFDSTVSTTGSITGTPKYFSVPHLKKLVDEMNDAVREAKAAGGDAAGIELAKDTIALGDNNALGITILDQREFFATNRAELQRSWGMDATTFDSVLSDYDSIIKRLTDPKQTVPYSDVVSQLEKAKQKIIKSRKSSAEALPMAA